MAALELAAEALKTQMDASLTELMTKEEELAPFTAAKTAREEKDNKKQAREEAERKMKEFKAAEEQGEADMKRLKEAWENADAGNAAAKKVAEREFKKAQREAD